MVMYEVNLTINNEIFDNYHKWLIEHIQEMMQFPGFQKAEVCKQENTENDGKTRLTVRYTLATRENLDSYLKDHAPKMRADGINRFGDQFSATRRIFINAEIIEPKPQPALRRM